MLPLAYISFAFTGGFTVPFAHLPTCTSPLISCEAALSQQPLGIVDCRPYNLEVHWRIIECCKP